MRRGGAICGRQPECGRVALRSRLGGSQLRRDGREQLLAVCAGGGLVRTLGCGLTGGVGVGEPGM
jgi:hypothetical protein